MNDKRLTCPNCASVFRVSADAVGDEGREVRCSFCSYSWLANRLDLHDADDETIASQGTIDIVVDEEPGENLLSASMSEDNTDLDSDSDLDSDTPPPDIDIQQETEVEPDHSDTSELDNLPPAFHQSLFTPSVVDDSEQKEELEQRNKTIIVMLSIANVISLLVLVGATSLVFRDTILNAVPEMHSLYESAGYASTRNVEMANIAFTQKERGKNTEFRIKGDIVNRGSNTSIVPSIRARLYDKDGNTLEEWMMESEGTIPAGESTEFDARSFKTDSDKRHILTLDIGSESELNFRE